MHIAFDAKRYFKNTSGLGRYSRTLIQAMTQLDDVNDLQITLFKPKGDSHFTDPNHPMLRIHQAEYRLPGDLGNGLWRFLSLPKILDRSNFTAFHGPSHVLPSKASCPMIVTMFDLIFLRFPEYFRRWDRQYYRYTFKKSAQRADRIISISDATKKDLIHYFGVSESKISVIYPAFDNVFSPLPRDELLNIQQKFLLPDKFILYVGTIEPRKNILRLAQAFDQLKNSKRIGSEFEFLVVGQKGWFYKDIFKGIEELKNKKQIRFLGPVYGKELAGIYQAASVMAYPSLFEGFGYPVIEAMSVGTPVLTSNISSLPEAGGNAAHLVDPLNINQICEGFTKLINDDVYRKELIALGFKHVQKFTPERMARETYSMYKQFAD